MIWYYGDDGINIDRVSVLRHGMVNTSSYSMSHLKVGLEWIKSRSLLEQGTSICGINSLLIYWTYLLTSTSFSFHFCWWQKSLSVEWLPFSTVPVLLLSFVSKLHANPITLFHKCLWMEWSCHIFCLTFETYTVLPNIQPMCYSWNCSHLLATMSQSTSNHIVAYKHPILKHFSA